MESKSNALLAQASTQVEESFRWLGLPPAWMVVLVVVPLVTLFVAYFYRREIPIGKPAWRWPLMGLRVAIILLALAMLAQPVRTKTTYESRDSTILVLVDDSLSMDIEDRYSDRDFVGRIADFLKTSPEAVEGTSRYELIRRLIGDSDLALLESLRQKGKVVVASFAGSVQEKVKLSRLHGDAPDEDQDSPDTIPSVDEWLPSYATFRADTRVQETRIADSIRDSVSSVVGSGFGDSEERVSGIVLLTDGQENAGSGSAAEIARRLGDRGTPIYCIGVGNPDEPKDVRIAHVDVDEVVLVDDNVSFDVSIVSEGFEGERVPVRLLIDSEPVESSFVTLEGGGKTQVERLEYRPRKPGEITVTIEVEKLGGEVFYDNNSVSKTIRVLDEKIRILYLDQLPRWEYRYLKNALVRDPTIEAQVWLYSADPEFVQESSPSVPALRRVPEERSELFKYHVVILGDDQPGSLGQTLATNLKEFVYEGGGLVFLSGRHANPLQYLHTDLYPVLPVEVPEPDRFGVGQSKPVTDPFKVQLTPEGQELTVMRLDNDRARNRTLWESTTEDIYNGLPSFFWYAKVGKEKASAVVLARHPNDEVPNSQIGRVIFGYMNYGKGRSFLSAVDNTWRWRAGVDNLYFARFWGQVIRFVATGRLLGKTPRFSVTTDKSVYSLGERIRVDARVFDANMKPLSDPTVTLYHQSPGREGEPPERIELALNEVKGQGAYEGVISASFRGRHDIWLGTETEKSAFHFFNVEIPVLESRDPRLNRDQLEKIAKASGGEYYNFYDAQQAFEKVQGVTRSQEGVVENDDLWDEWWIVILFTALIATEWMLRKVVRLL